jgi:VIT1/CCC1 family predicted Fe2+/Mn2+ transporter
LQPTQTQVMPPMPQGAAMQPPMMPQAAMMPPSAPPMPGAPMPGVPGMPGYPPAAAASWPAAQTQAPPPAPPPQQTMNHLSPATLALLRRLPPPPPEPRYFGRNASPKDEHRDVTGGWLRAAVFGAMDGVVTNASLIAGATGAHATNHTILLTGLAGLVAGAFSMATGEYISVTSQNEVTSAEVEAERRELERNPGRELAELAEVFMGKGLEPTLALEVARQLSDDPEQALTVHAREELGIDPDDLPSPWTAAGASFAAFTVGALTPLIPYLIGAASFKVSLILASLFAFGGGAVVAKAAERPAGMGGFRQFALGALATGMTFLVGHLVGAQVN